MQNCTILRCGFWGGYSGDDMIKKICIALLTVSVISCQFAEPKYTIQRLPSGRRVKVLDIGTVYFRNGEQGLLFKYRTDIDFDNKKDLMREVKGIGRYLQRDAEAQGLRIAVISAYGPPAEGMFAKTR